MSAASSPEVFAFSGFSLDTRQRLLFGPDGRAVPLSGRAFDTLLYLVEHPNQLIDKQALMKAVWPNVIVEENNLNQNISIVRRALGETAGEHRFVVTIPGRGFRFVPTVSRLDSEVISALRHPAASPPTEGSPPPTGASEADPAKAGGMPQSAAPTVPAAALLQTSDIRSWARRPWLSSIIIVGSAAILLAAYLSARQFWTGPPASVAPRLKDSSGAPAASVAVVPFANLTGDANKEYFSDGMAEELIHELSRVPGLKVPARTSSFAYKGRSIDIRQIARDLGVTTILEGSVRSAGEHIRVTAQLVNAQTGYDLWSKSFDSDSGDVFKLQDEISAEIVHTLMSTFDAQRPQTAVNARATARASAGPPTQDLEAYGLYLQARSLQAGYTDESMRKALELYDQAIARDPQFARAFSGRAETRADLFLLVTALPHALEDAEQDAKRALALDANSAQAHATLQVISAYRGDWTHAEASFRAALAAGPEDPGTLVKHAINVLESVGRLQQAKSEMTEAYRLAPKNVSVVINLAAANLMLDLDADALRFAALAGDLGGWGPTVPPLPEIYAGAAVHGGRYQEAAARMAEALPPALRNAGGEDAVRLVFSTIAEPGKRAAARQALRALIGRVDPASLTAAARKDFIYDFALLGALDDAYRLANDSLDQYARSGVDRIRVGVAVDAPDACLPNGCAVSGLGRAHEADELLDAVWPSGRVRGRAQ